jgi:hypothetical protein
MWFQWLLLSLMGCLNGLRSVCQVLYARYADQRSSTFAAALRMGEEYLRDSKALLLRASLLKHDLVQRPVAPVLPTPMSGQARSRRIDGGAGNLVGFSAMDD